MSDSFERNSRNVLGDLDLALADPQSLPSLDVDLIKTPTNPSRADLDLRKLDLPLNDLPLKKLELDVVSQIEKKKSDVEIRDEAMHAYADGDVVECLHKLQEINDEEIQALAVKELVEKSVSKGEKFGTAMRIAETLKDQNYKAQLIGWIRDLPPVEFEAMEKRVNIRQDGSIERLPDVEEPVVQARTVQEEAQGVHERIRAIVDPALEAKIDAAYDDEDFATLMELVKQIDNPQLQEKTKEFLVEGLIDKKDFYNARKFALSIQDSNKSEEMVNAVMLAYGIDPKKEKAKVNKDKAVQPEEPQNSIPVVAEVAIEKTDAIVDATSTQEAEETPAPVEIKKEYVEEDSVPSAIDIAMRRTNPSEAFVKHASVAEENVQLAKEDMADSSVPSAVELAMRKTNSDFAASSEIHNVDAVEKKREDMTDDSVLSAVEIAMRKTDHLVPEPRQIPTAIELAMRKTDHLVASVIPSTVLAPVEDMFSHEKIEAIEQELESARSDYSEKLVLWKSEKKKGMAWVRQNLAGLGITQPPAVEKPDELKALEERYMQAKKAKAVMIYDRFNAQHEANDITKEHVLTPELVKYIEEERSAIDSVQLPRKEKGMMGKVVDIWNKHPKTRMATTAALLSGGGFVFGAFAATGALTYAGMRVARGGATMLGAGVLNKKLQDRFDDTNETTKEAILLKYSKEFNPDNFEKKEREMAAALEKLGTTQKRQSLLKAAAMVGVGLGAAVGTEVASSKSFSLSGVKGSVENGKAGAAPAFENQITPPDNDPVVPPPAPEKAPLLTAEVSASSKGGIQTVHNLKAEIIRQYGGLDKVPAGLRADVLDKPAIKLAQDFKLYDPKDNMSAILLEGESIVADPKGNIVYQHLDGTKDVLYDAEKSAPGTGFAGDTQSGIVKNETTTPKAPEELPTVVVPEEPQILGVPEENFQMPPPLPKDLPVPPPVLDSMPENVTSVSFKDWNGRDILVGIEMSGPERKVLFKGIEIAQIKEVNGVNMVVLNDKFQDNSFFGENRMAFSAAFDKLVPLDKLGTTVETVPFEQGKIHIVQGIGDNPNALKVLLNGKEIAMGEVTEKGPKINLNANLKGGWFEGDNAYERAFKVVKGTLSGKVSK